MIGSFVTAVTTAAGTLDFIVVHSKNGGPRHGSRQVTGITVITTYNMVDRFVIAMTGRTAQRRGIVVENGPLPAVDGMANVALCRGHDMI